MKYWLIISSVYIILGYLFLYFISQAYLYFFQYLFLVPVFIANFKFLKVNPAYGINKSMLLLSYSFALTLVTWGLFWVLNFIFLILVCSINGCEL